MEKEQFIGIIGSRKRKDLHKVSALVDSLPTNCVVVSGGCKGVDSVAADRAKERGLDVVEFLPLLKQGMSYPEMVQAYYARNKKIAEKSEIIYAFVSEDRKGGTENTIKHAKALGKKIIIL